MQTKMDSSSDVTTVSQDDIANDAVLREQGIDPSDDKEREPVVCGSRASACAGVGGEVQQGILLAWNERSKRITCCAHIQKIQTGGALDRIGIQDRANCDVSIVAITGIIRQGGDSRTARRHVIRI